MKAKNKVLAGTFLAAALGIGGIASGDYVLSKSIENGSLRGAQFAKNVLFAEPSKDALPHYALAGRKDSVEVMLKLGTDAKTRQWAYNWAAGKGGNFYPVVLLEEEAVQQHAESIMELIQSYAETSEEAQAMMDHTLEQLIMGDDLEMIEYLLMQGADPNAVSVVSPSSGPRILGWAAANRAGKAIEVIDLLLQYGADPQLGLDYLSRPQSGEAKELLQERVRVFEQKNSPASAPALSL